MMDLEQLQATYRTLAVLIDQYKPESQEFATLCEAQRLVVVEIRLNFGDGPADEVMAR